MCVFFFKQKTAYEMRISDWSSDVCSSDLIGKEQQDSAKFSNWRPKATEPGRFVSYAVDDGMDCLSQLSQLSATRLRAVSSSGGQSLESAPSKPRRYYLSRIADAGSVPCSATN